MFIQIAVIDNEEKYLDQIISVASNYLESANEKGEIKGYIQPQELLWDLEDGKYSYFYTRRGTFRERLPLAKVYEKLQSDEFIYVDKGKIVNLKHVLELDNRSVSLRNRTVLRVSAPQRDYEEKSVNIRL